MMAEHNADRSSSVVDELIESVAEADVRPWRERSIRVGSVYTLSYSTAVVAVFDYDRELAGGLPQNSFLAAAKPEGGSGFILLRVRREARLPAASANDQTRQESIEDVGNLGPWSEKMPTWIKDKMSLHGLECSVLGTFVEHGDGTVRFAEDIDNYYAVSELMAWKPDAGTLKLIVNHQHRTNDISMGNDPVPIGRTRFAAAEDSTAVNVGFAIDPTDIMKRRTAYFGMSRSGKSNGIKVVAESIYGLRAHNAKHRIGQLIFDLSGEYAQDNFQDGKGLHRVYEPLGLERANEVATYGLIEVPWDKPRVLMKLNFYGDELPWSWSTDDDTAAVEAALEQLLAGKAIINEIMEGENARYTTAFRDTDLSVDRMAQTDKGAQTRYRRALLAYRTALYAAGLAVPVWAPTIRGIGRASLFSTDLVDALESADNAGSDKATDYHQAARILKTSKANNFSISWAQLLTVFEALAYFVEDANSAYAAFERNYINHSSSGDSWADARFKSLLRIFRFQNGPRSFQTAREQHNPNTTDDFAQAIVADLQAGKLVVIDQSAGDPDHNRAAAERVMWHLFRAQQDRFRAAAATLDPTQEPDPDRATEGHVIVYIEEAHNLLPRANAQDTLRTVWARSAKEGSKLNIGMVLATQAPSSVMPEILSETDNWVLSYLNSENERKVIAGYMDFGDFTEQIGKVSEQGYVRIRTLSQAYTVPVQLHKFQLEDAPDVDAAEPQNNGTQG